MPCLAAYLCIAVFPLANQELDGARLVEGTTQAFSPLLYVVSLCQAFVLKGCACTSVSESLMDG